MSIKADIAAAMTTDAILTGLLPGGVYTGPQLTPGMDAPHPFDAVGRVRPSALVRMEASATTGPANRFEHQFALVFFYDAAGYEVITAALERTQALLHGRYIGRGAFQLWQVDAVWDQYDDALAAFMHRARYDVTRRLGGFDTWREQL